MSLEQFEKVPTDELDYEVLWVSWLASGETISTSSWTVPSPLTQPVAASNTTTTATVWLTGGVVGFTYTVSNTVTTSAGRTEARSFQLSIVAAR